MTNSLEIHIKSPTTTNYKKQKFNLSKIIDSPTRGAIPFRESNTIFAHTLQGILNCTSIVYIILVLVWLRL